MFPRNVLPGIPPKTPTPPPLRRLSDYLSGDPNKTYVAAVMIFASSLFFRAKEKMTQICGGKKWGDRTREEERGN